MARAATRSAARASVVLVLPLLLAACGSPVRVSREDPHVVARELTSNVLTTGKPSLPSENILHRWGVRERFAKDPRGTLAALHQEVVEGRADSRELFALAELSFKHAEDTKDRAYYLAAVVYAYAFLFPGVADDAPGRLDPRLRIAADLYNRGLTAGFASADGETVDLRPGTYQLPFGQLAVNMAPDAFDWRGRGLYHFVPVAELKVEGLEARYRRPGIGAPLAAKAWVEGEMTGPDAYVAKRARVPVTAFLRIDDARRQLAQPMIDSTLDIYDSFATKSVTIDGRSYPLEVEPTATLAWGLADSPIWSWEISGFLTGDLLSRERTQLALVEPHQPGRIPVVFVHGTASSPGRWADMLNDLQAEPSIRERFEFWFFFYTTGNPIPYSAALLRDTLTKAVHTFDPEGNDPAMREMVVIGHSQGGLLTKMTVIDPKDRFWHMVSDKPIDEIRMRPQTRAIIESALFPKPLPFVRRVIFISTPHGGSYVAAFSISRLVSRFVKLPGDLLAATADLATGKSPIVGLTTGGAGVGAVYGMTPGSRLIKALSAEPIVPGVHAHSIIAVRGTGPVEDGADGVVAYKSAHIEGVDSEKVVNSSHSCQSKPETIAEVRRILVEHAEDTCTRERVGCPTAATSPASPRRQMR
jgi:pimeloyl-ACP methyl ester carboxylesterase